jgi:hypothetical protein
MLTIRDLLLITDWVRLSSLGVGKVWLLCKYSLNHLKADVILGLIYKDLEGNGR